MPELPEVETVARGLAKVLLGKTIAQAQIRRPDLRKPFPKDLAKRLQGRKIADIGRRAKYVLIRLANQETLIVHLGMSGRILLGKGEPPKGKHAHFALVTTDGAYACLEDPRRFGLVDIASKGEIDAHPLLAGLGLEPFDPELDAKRFHNLLSRRSGPVKTALLDQKLVVGIGNIYASEALFRAGLSPLRKACAVTAKEAEKLLGAIRQVLEEAIESGGSSLRDHIRPDGELGYFQHHFNVYDKEGQPCPRCLAKSRVTRVILAGRSSFYCQRCQR